jgi:chloride channel protein, CIC family
MNCRSKIKLMIFSSIITFAAMLLSVHKGIIRLHRRLTERQFLFASSIFVGVMSAFAAIILKTFVHWINEKALHYAEGYEQFLGFTFLPLLGIGLCVFYVRRVLRGDFEKGTAEVIINITKKSGKISSKQIQGNLITSGLTVGFGGSTGLESPLVSTGSAIGSVYAQSFRLSLKERTVLLACGASAGIAAAFNSPIAGVLFAVEVILVDISMSAFIPLIIAAASGALVSKVIMQEGVLLSFSLQQPFDYKNVPYYVALGALCGFISLLYSRIFVAIESRMSQIHLPYVRVLVGGIILAALLILFPSLFGEGYISIQHLAGLDITEITKNSILYPFLRDDFAVIFFLTALVFMKIVAAGVTLGSGGNGGNFGPSLFVGAYTGAAFARTVNILDMGRIPESNFTIVAMAGILSGLLYAPLTGIFLIAEITGGYDLMIPLMIVSVGSITIARYFEPLSMEQKKVARAVKFSLEDRDKYLLSKLDFNEMIETNFEPVHPEETLKHLIKAISSSHRNIFPVLDKQNLLMGVIHLDDVREIIFDTTLYSKTTITSLMRNPPAVISLRDDLHTVLKKFDDAEAWNLPVTDEGGYVGFLSKSSILARYRKELVSTL